MWGGPFDYVAHSIVNHVTVSFCFSFMISAALTTYYDIMIYILAITMLE